MNDIGDQMLNKGGGGGNQKKKGRKQNKGHKGRLNKKCGLR